MKTHRQFHNSSSQFLQPSNVFVADHSVYDTLRSNTSYEKNHRAPSPYLTSMPRSTYSVSNMARSSSNLHSLDKRANADPELMGCRKSKNGYHLSVDLKAHLLNGLQRHSSSTQRSNKLSSEQRYTQTNLRNEFNRSNADIAGLNGGSRVSMVNLTGINNFPVPPPIITRHKNYSSNQRTVVDLEGARNNNILPASSQVNVLGDGYIMKSCKASESRKVEREVAETNKENVEFDLNLFGTVSKQINKVASEARQRPINVQKEGESRANRREVIEESEVTHRTNVGIPNFNIKPPKARRSVVEEKISTGIIETLNNATYDLEEEEAMMLERLMRGAPADSYQKEINVERETEEIFGPLPEEEVEKLYAKEIINVDVISEIVHLEVDNRTADVQLKLTFNKIVPVHGSKDTFKMTKVVVNKNILVDLTVTEERRKICDEVLRIQQNGILDKEYTWMLYRIFSTLADKGNTLGVSEGRVRVDKEVGEERVYDLNKEMYNSRGNTGRKFQILEDTFLRPDERQESSRPNSSYDRNDLSRSTSGWSYQDAQRSSFVEPRERHLYNGGSNQGGYNAYKNAQPRKETIESHDYFSEVNSPRKSGRINEASKNINKPRDSSWKREFSRWLSTDRDSAVSNRNHRIDVHNYLRPGGSRNYDYLINEDTSYQRVNEGKPELRHESISGQVLNHNGLRGGAHRERMRSYERGLDRNEYDSIEANKPSYNAGTRKSRKNYREVGLY